VIGCYRHAMEFFCARCLAFIASLFMMSSASVAHAQDVILSTPAVVGLSISTDQADAGSNVTFTASVTTARGGGVPAGTVQFIDETTMAVLGWAGAARPTITIGNLAVGQHRIRADYSGTVDFLPMVIQPGRSALSILTVRDAVEVNVSSSVSPSEPGQLVTLTAMVTSHAGLLKGAVTFRDGTSVLAAHVGLDSGGTASFTTSALSDGSRAIIAEYEGDGEHASAFSPRLVQDVGVVRIRHSMLSASQ
jgi:hypothetical protein